MITQDVGDLLKNDAGKALLNNSEYTLLLRQKPSIIEQVQKTFQLSAQERERLLTAQTGEGIIIISNEHSEIKVIASPEEHEVITTNADEKLAKELAKAQDIVTEFKKSTLDYDKGFFKKKELTQEEVEELLKHGYHLSSHIGLFGGRQEDYLLKPRSNESAEHFFVIKVIEEYIRKYAEKVKLFEMKDADIVFEHNGKKIALEIETGNKYDKDKKYLQEKVKQLNKKYGQDWFFVVTDWKYKENYQELGTTYVRREVPAILKKRYFSTGSKFSLRASETHKFSAFEVQKPPIISPDSIEPLNLGGTNGN